MKYKYKKFMTVYNKSRERFLKDFFENRFDQFLSGDIELWVSPILSNLEMFFSIDFDFRKQNNKYEIKRIFKHVNKYFNIEVSPNGFHLISKYKFLLPTSLERFRKEIAKATNYNMIDYTASFRDNPMTRLGYSKEKKRTYYPIIDEVVFKENKLLPIEIYNEDIWKEYIIHNLIPKKFIDYRVLLKNLEKTVFLLK